MTSVVHDAVVAGNVPGVEREDLPVDEHSAFIDERGHVELFRCPGDFRTFGDLSSTAFAFDHSVDGSDRVCPSRPPLRAILNGRAGE